MWIESINLRSKCIASGIDLVRFNGLSSNKIFFRYEILLSIEDYFLNKSIFIFKIKRFYRVKATKHCFSH